MNYEIHINDFDGPFDLLLHLIKEAKMDIYDINIADITKQYLDFINQMKDLNIDIASTYLVMASELIHLKSKLLINREDDVEEETEFSLSSEDDLKQKLIEYQKYKDIAENFKELEDKRKEVYTRLPDSLDNYKETDYKNSSNVSADDLYNALLNFLDRQKYMKPLNTKITKKEYSVKLRRIKIKNLLKDKTKVKFFDLFDIITKDYVIVTFLAVLEMVKDNEVTISQKDSNSDINIEVKK